MVHAEFLGRMTESGLVLVESGLGAFYYYVIGIGKSVVAAAANQRFQDGVPVFIDNCGESLLQERDQVSGSTPMGFLKNVFVEDWERGLPSSPAFVCCSFCLSGKDDSVKKRFLDDVYQRLREGGSFLWADVFLPQRLSYLAAYQEEFARVLVNKQGGEYERCLDQIKEEYSAQHNNACLMARSMEYLYEAGFGNVEVTYKWLNFALLAARK